MEDALTVQVTMKFASQQDVAKALDELGDTVLSSAIVDSTDAAGPPPFRRSRLALLVWVAVYVLLNVFLILTAPLLGSAPLLVRTLVATAIVVPIVVIWVIPHVGQRFAGWLSA